MDLIFSRIWKFLYRNSKDIILEQKNFSVCEAANNVLKQYQVESDTVQLFLEDYEFEKCSDDYVLMKDLYPLYRSFCIDDGCIAIKKINFRKRLENLSIVIDKKGSIGNVVYISSKKLRL